jgi:hypothetical protein
MQSHTQPLSPLSASNTAPAFAVSDSPWRYVALALMAMPFVAFATPQLPWRWTAPLFVAVGLLLGRNLPQWRGHALIWSAFSLFMTLGVPWPLSLILPSLMVPSLKRWWPSLREIAGNLRWGRLDRATCLLAAAIVVVSSTALVGWFKWGGADVSDIVAMVPRSPLPLLLGGVLVFSIANALWEELLMKWLMWDGVERLVQSRAFVIGYQAAFFGLLHFHGFPRGWLGVALAAGYGLLLGFLRARSGGLLALVVTHVFADVTICLLIISKLEG